PQFIERLASEIDAAKTEVNLLYYIFAPDGAGERIAQSLERAAQRGVRCRLLVDAVGARPFLHRAGVARRLGRAGVTLAAAAPVEHPHDIEGTAMQVIPTGPSSPVETYRRVLLAALQCARESVVLTTPYFVPDEPTLVALLMAADRGVDVTLIVPRTGDGLLS